MATITLNEEQLKLVQIALDFYISIGIGKFTEIKNHPTFQNYLYDFCAPCKTPEIGDTTPQGEILDIKKGKALINGSVKNGMWCSDKSWVKLGDVRLSTDYEKYHSIREKADAFLTKARNNLMQYDVIGKESHWGIHNGNVDESCREAYHMLQVIRYERNKACNSYVDSDIKDKIDVKI